MFLISDWQNSKCSFIGATVTTGADEGGIEKVEGKYTTGYQYFYGAMCQKIRYLK